MILNGYEIEIDWWKKIDSTILRRILKLILIIMCYGNSYENEQYNNTIVVACNIMSIIFKCFFLRHAIEFLILSVFFLL